MHSWDYLIHDDLIAVDKYIKESLKSSHRVLSEAVSQLVNAGGKRLRPALLLLAGHLGKYDREHLVPMAASVEILHMATLVHDDIIDESKLRRGKPTVQSRWGKDIAVFTGDFLFAKSFLLVAQKISHKNMQNIAKAVQAICKGEIDQYETRYMEEISINRYLKRIARKTALLFALSCRVGAEESDCSKKVVSSVTNFGKAFGMAFQITDDLLDFQGEEEKVGKPLLNDFVQGVYTLPVIFALQNKEYREEVSSLINKKDLTGEEIKGLVELIKKSGGLEYSKGLAKRYIARARKSLDKIPEGSARDSLERLLNELIERRY